MGLGLKSTTTVKSKNGIEGFQASLSDIISSYDKDVFQTVRQSTNEEHIVRPGVNGFDSGNLVGNNME